MLYPLTAVVFDGEVGAGIGQAEAEVRRLVVFICGSQSPNNLRKQEKKTPQTSLVFNMQVFFEK